MFIINIYRTDSIALCALVLKLCIGSDEFDIIGACFEPAVETTA
jgi:hypothetical protein